MTPVTACVRRGDRGERVWLAASDLGLAWGAKRCRRWGQTRLRRRIDGHGVKRLAALADARRDRGRRVADQRAGQPSAGVVRDRARSRYLNVADRLYQLPLGLIGIAVGVAMLPRLSRLVHEGDAGSAPAARWMRRSRSRWRSRCRRLQRSSPFPYFMIDGLYARGAFSAEDARNVAPWRSSITAGACPRSCWRRSTRRPSSRAKTPKASDALRSSLSMVMNIVLGAQRSSSACVAMGVAGFPGLAIATSAAAWLNVLLMIRSLVGQRGAYGPTASKRMLAVGFAYLMASAMLFCSVFGFANANRAGARSRTSAQRKRRSSRVIWRAGSFYFALAFFVRAVTLRRSARSVQVANALQAGEAACRRAWTADRKRVP